MTEPVRQLHLDLRSDHRNTLMGGLVIIREELVKVHLDDDPKGPAVVDGRLQ